MDLTPTEECAGAARGMLAALGEKGARMGVDEKKATAAQLQKKSEKVVAALQAKLFTLL